MTENFENYFELLPAEKDYYSKLTMDERYVYTADQYQLKGLDTYKDDFVHSFVVVAQLLDELQRTHTRYNDFMAHLDDHPSYQLEAANEELFSMSMSIGNYAAVFNLSIMDECDELYKYLATVKMNRFNYVCDTIDISLLVEKMKGC